MKKILFVSISMSPLIAWWFAAKFALPLIKHTGIEVYVLLSSLILAFLLVYKLAVWSDKKINT